MEKSDTSEYEPTDQEESEPLHTDDELVETSDEDELNSTMRDRILKKKGTSRVKYCCKKKKGKRES